MENQHRKISGYRELSQEEIDLMNEIKAAGPALEALFSKVKAYVSKQQELAETNGDAEEVERLSRANPTLWADWAYSTGQNALMYATRAVAQPTFY